MPAYATAKARACRQVVLRPPGRVDRRRQDTAGRRVLRGPQLLALLYRGDPLGEGPATPTSPGSGMDSTAGSAAAVASSARKACGCRKGSRTRLAAFGGLHAHAEETGGQSGRVCSRTTLSLMDSHWPPPIAGLRSDAEKGQGKRPSERSFSAVPAIFLSAVSCPRWEIRENSSPAHGGLIPGARKSDTKRLSDQRFCPIENGAGADASRLGDQAVPGVAASIDDGVRAGEQPPRQEAVAQVAPHRLDGVAFRWRRARASRAAGGRG